ncbi:MAG TPA: OmpH family outer membrane protein [Gemmatimonadaceae bacterium]|jgi:outer membrane protein|nr:OmpH family outer membrane protein [Gemmatimonadaceae bacterium]
MRSIVRATAIALALTVTARVAQAQQPGQGKIVFVNTQALMEAAPGRVAAESLLNKEGKGFQDQLQKMQDSLNKLLSDYQKAEPTLSTTAKDARQKAIQAMETDLQAKNLQFQQQFDQRKSEIMSPITDMVKKVLDDIRDENGYAMILMNDPGQSVIVSADKNLDVTDKAVSRLRTQKAPAAAATTKPATPNSPAGVTRPKPPVQ